jgi:hypothetical protein
VYLTSFVCHMMYLGHEYVLHRGHGHSLAENGFAMIFSHFAVLFIMMMRDHFAHLPISLDMNGSDCCEDIFTLLGQEIHNKKNFSFEEALK